MKTTPLMSLGLALITLLAAPAASGEALSTNEIACTKGLFLRRRRLCEWQ